MCVEIKPLPYVDATVTVPGSKSHTQRALVIASLAEGESFLYNVLISEDTLYLIEGLRSLGVQFQVSHREVIITGTGGNIRLPQGKTIYMGNNGTGLRFFTSLVALGKGEVVLDGNSRLQERPVKPLLDALGELGVSIESRHGRGYPPLKIRADGLKGGVVSFGDVESSQYISSLLISSPYARDDVEIHLEGKVVSEPYIDMTLQVIDDFGVVVERDGKHCFRVRPGQRYKGRRYRIEADVSSASYFFLAAALCGGRIRVLDVSPNSLQGDIAFLDILERFGCTVVRGDSWVEVIGRALPGGEMVIDMGNMPDMVPTLAVLASFRSGRTRITNVSHLRFKESDRIATVVAELKRIGINAEELEDGLVVNGGKPRGAEIETYDDHRIAMSFAVAGLVVPGMKIRNPHCVKKSFPEFWDTLNTLYKKD